MTMNNDDIYRKLGRRLKNLRKHRGLTQSETAKEASISFKYYQRIEGSKPPVMRLETVFQLSRVLNVSLADLFDAEEFQS